MGEREGHGPHVRRRPRPAPTAAVVIRLEQRGYRGVELLVVGSLTLSEARGSRLVRRTEPHRVEQREHPLQPGLQDRRPRRPAALRRSAGSIAAISSQVRWLSKTSLRTASITRLLGRERAEHRAFGDAGSLGDLPRADVSAELLQQRLGGGDQGSTTLVVGRGAARLTTCSLVSECSLIKGFNGKPVRSAKMGSSVPIEEGHVALGRLSNEIFDAVIFDMDGTLIDSVPAVERSWGSGLPSTGWTSTRSEGSTASRRPESSRS